MNKLYFVFQTPHIYEAMYIAILFTIIQLSGAYLRYLPFSRELSAQEFLSLKKYFFAWSFAGLAINFYFFSCGITYRAYQSALFSGWLPYFFISLTVIQKRLPQHIFVLGMQLLWFLMVHSFAEMGITLLYGTTAEKFLPLQIIFYVVLFAFLFGVSKKFFINLLPTQGLFEDKNLRWLISALPLAIFFGSTISIVDLRYLPALNEKLSRLMLPIFFFLIYHAMSAGTRQIHEEQLQTEKVRILSQQVKKLEERNFLIIKNRYDVMELQKNLLDNYRTLDEFLAENKIKAAISFIEQQTTILDSTRQETFCLAPLLNAALSIYFNRAKNIGADIHYKINLPAKFSTDESDLAVLISNLLENAITASEKQNPAEREISLIIRLDGKQYILDISNRYDHQINLGENGLPYTTKIGHGLGMSSLESFAKKYNAFVDFSYEEGYVQISMYWNDYFEAK